MSALMEVERISLNGRTHVHEMVVTDMVTTLVLVTPDMAKEWLSGNGRNRRLSESVVRRICEDIKGGRWVITHQGIAFDRHGTLLDGQHRLTAIALSGVTVPVLVTRNCDPGSILNIDQNMPRRAEDVLTIEGTLGPVSRLEMATLRQMTRNLKIGKVYSNNSKRGIMVERDLLRKHRDAIRFAHGVMPSASPRLIDATTRSVVARAYYSANHEKLSRFCRVLSDQVATAPDEQVIATLIKTLTRVNGSRPSVADRYARIERALAAFLAGDNLLKIYAATSELFPLPEEVLSND